MDPYTAVSMNSGSFKTELEGSFKGVCGLIHGKFGADHFENCIAVSINSGS